MGQTQDSSPDLSDDKPYDLNYSTTLPLPHSSSHLPSMHYVSRIELSTFVFITKHIISFWQRVRLLQ